jgi:hypothetical protein
MTRAIIASESIACSEFKAETDINDKKQDAKKEFAGSTKRV